MTAPSPARRTARELRGRPPGPVRRAPAFVASVAALSAVAVSLVALAEPRLPGAVSNGWLSGGGPRVPERPVDAPYTIGWTTALVPPSLWIKPPAQPAGLAVDERSGWVYAATGEGHVVAVDAGHVRFDVEVATSLVAAPALLRELLVVPSTDGVLSILNKVTGERRTRAILGEELITTPVLVESPQGPRAYVGTTFESVFAVDLATGSKLWRLHHDIPAGFTLTGFARPIVHGDTLFAAFADGNVVAVDANTGAPKWETKVSPKGAQVDVDGLATNGSLLFAASASGGLVALDPADGHIVWRQAIPGAARVSTDGIRVFVSAPGQVAAFESSRGIPAYKFTLDPRRMSATPLVIEDTLVAPIIDGPVYFLDRRTGAPLGRFGSGSGFEATAARVGRVLYLLSNAGRLYAVGLAR